jgi:adenylate cyclase
MMQPLVSRVWNRFLRSLLKRIVFVLTLMLCLGGGIALSNITRLSSNLIQSQAVQNAALYIESFNQAINLYSDAAADRVRAVGLVPTHAYLSQEGAIPLPSTFAIELGDRISERNDAISARFYSDYPFPWRQQGGPRDEFEQAALKSLRQNPQQPFSRVERVNGQAVLRYGEASIMQATCVTCHNTHPDSPKTDWEVGNVAGVWEISQPLNNLVTQVEATLRETTFTLGGLSVLGVFGLTLVIGKLKQAARELEGQVQERTLDLTHANADLEQRNQLIRQVFGRYLSNDVVANLLETPEGLKLGGDRRQVTILTSDLRGFTPLSERLQPEEVITILNLYLEHMAEVINKYQGTIDEFMGDGILVLFGAPAVRADDALRAVACACEMQLMMGAVNERMQALGLPHLEMGIGIHTGDVVVGNIGSEKRTKYGIVGSPVNLTYRIESYTRGGQILISEAALKTAGASVKISSQAEVQLKGIQQPITIHEVYGVSGTYNLYLPK